MEIGKIVKYGHDNGTLRKRINAQPGFRGKRLVKRVPNQGSVIKRAPNRVSIYVYKEVPNRELEYECPIGIQVVLKPNWDTQRGKEKGTSNEKHGRKPNREHARKLRTYHQVYVTVLKRLRTYCQNYVTA